MRCKMLFDNTLLNIIYVTVNVYTQEICIFPEKKSGNIFPDSLRNFVYLLKMSGNIHIS